jgi:tetratricopeptide (TPR) repeat protein
VQSRLFSRNLIITFFLATALVLALVPTALASDAAPQTEVPAFALRGFDGGTIELEARRGQPLTAVIFFATWNPRSHQALVDIGELREQYAQKGFDVIMVCSESETFPSGFDDTLFDYLAGTNADVPVAMDEGLETYQDWHVRATPSTYFVDKDLRQINFIGSAPSSYKMMVEDIIKEALGLVPEEDEADKGPTRYQAARPQLLGYGMASKLAQRGRSRKAKKKIEEVLKADPDFPDAHALLGMILLHGKKNDPEAAKAAFDKALETDSELPMALLGKAHFTLAADELGAAVALIREALSKHAWGFTHKPEAAKIVEIEATLASVAGEKTEVAEKSPDTAPPEAVAPSETAAPAEKETAEKPPDAAPSETVAPAETSAPAETETAVGKPADAKALVQAILDEFLVLKKKLK